MIWFLAIRFDSYTLANLLVIMEQIVRQLLCRGIWALKMMCCTIFGNPSVTEEGRLFVEKWWFPNRSMIESWGGLIQLDLLGIWVVSRLLSFCESISGGHKCIVMSVIMSSSALHASVWRSLVIGLCYGCGSGNGPEKITARIHIHKKVGSIFKIKLESLDVNKVGFGWSC